MEPCTALRMKAPVGFVQWSDTVTRRYVFITKHYVTEANSFHTEDDLHSHLHRAGRTLTADWSVKSFIIVANRNIF